VFTFAVVGSGDGSTLFSPPFCACYTSFFFSALSSFMPLLLSVLPSRVCSSSVGSLFVHSLVTHRRSRSRNRNRTTNSLTMLKDKGENLIRSNARRECSVQCRLCAVQCCTLALPCGPLHCMWPQQKSRLTWRPHMPCTPTPCCSASPCSSITPTVTCEGERQATAARFHSPLLLLALYDLSHSAQRSE
jgi:predicted molibdopterin-dependent oxidoreductase YjgC